MATNYMKIRFLFFLHLFATGTPAPLFAQSSGSLPDQIERITAGKHALVGIAVAAADGKEVLTIQGDKRFPMQSVFKFHIALAVLSAVDEGKFTLDQQVEILKKDLLPGLWSPLREEFPEGGRFSIQSLLGYTVSQSDNVGCDALLRLLGGPQVVEGFIKKNQISDISIQINEETMQSNWDLMFQNWTTPRAANEVLVKFYSNSQRQLSPESHAFIWRLMRETQTGAGRLNGQLPEGTTVAHKTGSSGTNEVGLTAAVNDIGIIFLPDGNYFYISTFITESTEDEATNDRLIADIARVCYDYFLTQP
nr:VEB-PER [uncultured bacterium]